MYNFAYWDFFHVLCRLLFFIFKINFLKKYFSNTTRVSNSLDPVQARHTACNSY